MSNDNNRGSVKWLVKILSQTVQVIVCLVQLFVTTRVKILCIDIMHGVLQAILRISTVGLVVLGGAIWKIHVSRNFGFGRLLEQTLPSKAWHLKIVFR